MRGPYSDQPAVCGFLCAFLLADFFTVLWDLALVALEAFFGVVAAAPAGSATSTRA